MNYHYSIAKINCDRSIEVNNFKFIFENDESDELEIEGECTSANLRSALDHFHKSVKRQLIFTCEQVTFAVMFYDDKFIFFDSYERTLNGFPVNDSLPMVRLFYVFAKQLMD